MSFSQRRERPQRGGDRFMLFILAARVFEAISNSDHPVPITIGALITNVYPFLFDVNFFGYSLSNHHQICLHPNKIVNSGGSIHSAVRLIGSGFVHQDNTHLYYNMLSLCYKGISLEGFIGSQRFLFVIFFSLILSHSLVVFLSFFSQAVFYDIFGYNSCAVGFSAVLYSLKYICSEVEYEHNYYNNREVNLLPGVRVGAHFRYMIWIELLLNKMLVPNSSLTGHMCGILAGIVYIKLVRGKRLMNFRM